MRILLGIGGTEEDWNALEETIARAIEADDEVTVGVYEADLAEESLEETEQRVTERLAEAPVEAEVQRISGHPGGSLVEMADGDEFDRLVVAGGSRSTLGKIQLSSVAEFVVLNAETPVTLIR